MDKKIRAAAENGVHEYDERKWQDMQSLLDRHLPQEKKRRRIIFLIVFSALFLTGGYFLYNKLSAPSSPEMTSQTHQPAAKSPVPNQEGTYMPGKQYPSQEAITPTDTKDQPIAKPSEYSTTTVNKDGLHSQLVNNIPKTTSPSARNNKKIREKNSITNQRTITEDKNPVANKQSQPPSMAGKATNPEPSIVQNQQSEAHIPVDQVSNLTEKQSKKEPITSKTNDPDKTSSIAASDTEKPDSSSMAADSKQQLKKKKNSRLSFNLSFGPDVSAVNFNEPGKMKFQIGVGLGYAITDRWTVRAGFFAGRKVYTADSTNYHMNTSGMYSYRLYEVNADCYIYEMPLTVVYNFKSSKNHNWFLSSGLSSYIMHTEDYDYTYKNPWGQTVKYSHDYRNQNSHFFSVLNFSGGYRQQISKRFSILAEPYLKMPLGGVGVGKVKLNNTGVLFTASLQPFK